MNADYQYKKVSVIIPCRNEKDYLDGLVQNILDQDYPKDHLEVFLIDGMSDDGSGQLIEDFCNEHKHLNYLKNEAGYVPHGLNKAIGIASGQVILRMDAHSIYPKDYISVLVKELYALNADNVGGVWDIQPAKDSEMAKVIAYSNGHPFGIGNAQYRYADDNTREVDTVPFGCYRAEVFERIGLFDEDLIRNQDDEFNARLTKNKGKIFLIPALKIKYFARENFRKMSKMFYQYGLFKPLVNKKLGKISSIRQLFPVILIIGSLILAALSLTHPIFLKLLALGWIGYLALAITFSLSYGIKFSSVKGFFLLIVCFVLIHLSYGWGYLLGLLTILTGNKPGKKSISR